MNLKDLIDVHRGGRTYAELARDAGGTPSGERIRQLLNQPMKSFPDPASMKGLARALKVNQGVVVLAAAESLGLDVRKSGSRLTDLLPAKADRLTHVQAAAIAHLVDVIVPAADGEQRDRPTDLELMRQAAEEARTLGISLASYVEDYQVDRKLAEDRLMKAAMSLMEPSDPDDVERFRVLPYGEFIKEKAGPAAVAAAARKGTGNLHAVRNDDAGEENQDPGGHEPS